MSLQAKNGELRTFDTSDEACSKYRVKSGQRVILIYDSRDRHHERHAKVLGVSEGHLWFLVKGYDGPCYWDAFRTRETYPGSTKYTTGELCTVIEKSERLLSLKYDRIPCLDPNEEINTSKEACNKFGFTPGQKAYHGQDHYDCTFLSPVLGVNTLNQVVIELHGTRCACVNAQITDYRQPLKMFVFREKWIARQFLHTSSPVRHFTVGNGLLYFQEGKDLRVFDNAQQSVRTLISDIPYINSLAWSQQTNNLYANMGKGKLFVHEIDTRKQVVKKICDFGGKLVTNSLGDIFVVGRRGVWKLDIGKYDLLLEFLHQTNPQKESPKDISTEWKLIPDHCQTGAYSSVCFMPDGTIFVACYLNTQMGNIPLSCHHIKDGTATTLNKDPPRWRESGDLSEVSILPEHLMNANNNTVMTDQLQFIDLKAKKVSQFTFPYMCYRLLSAVMWEGEIVVSMRVPSSNVFFSEEGPGGLFKLQHMWSVERLVWIGNMKEDAKYCCLANVPKEIIVHIIGYWIGSDTVYYHGYEEVLH